MTREIPGVLLLYNHSPQANAPTIMEHVNAFEQHSRYYIRTVNTAYGFSPALKDLRFRVVLLHYSLFGTWPYALSPPFYRYIEHCRSSYKIAFFQDEYRFCQQRFSFVNRFELDCVYTRVRPEYFAETYRKYTSVRSLIHTLAGYVSENLLEIARDATISEDQRPIDIGYRARRLDFYMGRGAQEKSEIAAGFLRRSTGLGLRLDISCDPVQRVYGSEWYEFLAGCKACLGVEGGVSVFDLEGSVYSEYNRIMRENSVDTFDEFERLGGETLRRWEGKIPYRSFTPRHFEAAALRVCQILFEGEFSKMMEPMVHYIPLKKDFSNLNEVIERFRDSSIRNALTDNAYRDLIASGRYSYRSFIEDFDARLEETGIEPVVVSQEIRDLKLPITGWDYCRLLRYYSFPGKPILRAVYRCLVNTRRGDATPW